MLVLYLIILASLRSQLGLKVDVCNLARSRLELEHMSMGSLPWTMVFIKCAVKSQSLKTQRGFGWNDSACVRA
jgi:hypothetical protein